MPLSLLVQADFSVFMTKCSTVSIMTLCCVKRIPGKNLSEFLFLLSHGYNNRENLIMRNDSNRRISRERKTVEAMIEIFCRDQHGTAKNLCPECTALREYARRRLERCVFGEKKPTCANCRVHCYQPEMRKRIKQVMRYSGPRMTYRHPIRALFHFIDGFRKPLHTKKAGK